MHSVEYVRKIELRWGGRQRLTQEHTYIRTASMSWANWMRTANFPSNKLPMRSFNLLHRANIASLHRSYGERITGTERRKQKRRVRRSSEIEFCNKNEIVRDRIGAVSKGITYNRREIQRIVSDLEETMFPIRIYQISVWIQRPIWRIM